MTPRPGIRPLFDRKIVNYEYERGAGLYEPYGQLLGNMHALATQYRSAELAWKRLDWDNELDESLVELVKIVDKFA